MRSRRRARPACFLAPRCVTPPRHSCALCAVLSLRPPRGAAGGELFTRIASAPAQRFGEAQARFFFGQIMSGISYVHSQKMAHRDLKLENALLMDDGPRPRLAICDFGYTKSTALHSAFHTGNVGTPSYLAPELLTLSQGQTYDGRAVDVWAAGVVLYVMLVGGYPFGDLANGRELVRRIASATYSVPVPLSASCTDLLSKIFVVNPAQRITVADILEHAWMTADPPPPPSGPGATPSPEAGLQSVEALQTVLREAAQAPAPTVDDAEAALKYTEEDHLRDSMHDV